jgi:prolipoprotein diacylglyceryl transferase
MTLFSYITWTVSPEIFSLGPISVRYYGLFFAISFLLGYYLVEKMFKRENAPENWMDSLFVYVVVGTVLGARLGHVFFYGWDYYSQHPEEILMVWHGGLASHGGAIGIFLAIWLYSKKVTKKPFVWTMDKLVVGVALAAFFIRMGNLMNSEIVGRITDVPWAFQFINASGINNPELPRHPTQIYEALCYLSIFGVLMYMYWRTDAREKLGLLFGTFLTLALAGRFLLEFLKENQEAFEETMAINMGQILSIPFFLLGVYLVYAAINKPAVQEKKVLNGKKK